MLYWVVFFCLWLVLTTGIEMLLWFFQRALVRIGWMKSAGKPGDAVALSALLAWILLAWLEG